MSKHISDFKQHLDELVKLRDEYDAEVVPSYALPNGVDIGEIYSYANSFKQAITLAEELHSEVERLNKQNNSFLKAASRNLKKYNQLSTAADKMKVALAVSEGLCDLFEMAMKAHGGGHNKAITHTREAIKNALLAYEQSQG